MTLVVGISTLFETCLADDAAALWLLEDEAFVHAASTLLVEGEVATDDSMHFVLLLRQGFSKHLVLAAMAVRWGEAFRPGRLPGVRRRLGHYRLSRWPIVGGLIRLVFGLPSESISARRLRIIENQLYLLARSMCDLAGNEQFPAAPWGGGHRVPLLQALLDAESKMSPEVKRVYVALMSAVDQMPPDEAVL